jgi:membrane-bound metal-dependent hydrolase YbcI (DUF457 family)
MSSKPVHTLAGLCIGTTLVLTTRPDALNGALLLLGSHVGASAPDWMEIPLWVKHRRWFGADESRRYSLIPHRTLTHTLSLWLVCFIYAAIELGGVSSSYLNLFAFGFCASVLAHLLLDMRTPMGIPCCHLANASGSTDFVCALHT